MAPAMGENPPTENNPCIASHRDKVHNKTIHNT